MTPTDDLREYWRTLPTFADVSIEAAPKSSQIVPPVIVLRPDTPWSTPGDDSVFCWDHQRYVAVCVASATSPLDAMRRIYAMWQKVINNLPGAWRFDTVDGLVLDETTGTALLATQVHLSYFNSQPVEEES